ncbi:MAG: hypothetical protein D6683_00420 [Actinomyces sp.]|nr:MAG: hypothetical protein D6683_00420 [Actinomyces sp.]
MSGTDPSAAGAEIGRWVTADGLRTNVLDEGPGPAGAARPPLVLWTQIEKRDRFVAVVRDFLDAA